MYSASVICLVFCSMLFFTSYCVFRIQTSF